MVNDYSVSLFYWCKRENKNAQTTFTLNNTILGLMKKVQEWIKQCEELERNPLSISLRYLSGSRFGGSAREMLNCTVHEFFNMFGKDEKITFQKNEILNDA